MKNKTIAGFIAGTLTAVAGGIFADVAIPHTFSSGGKALASEVNNNFNALANAINALSSQLDSAKSQAVTLVVKNKNGTVIGKLGGQNGFFVRVNGVVVDLSFDSENKQAIERGDVLFTSPDCSGDAYITYDGLNNRNITGLGDLVRSGASKWYFADSATSPRQTVTFNSAIDGDGTCQTGGSSFAQEAFKATPATASQNATLESIFSGPLSVGEEVISGLPELLP